MRGLDQADAQWADFVQPDSTTPVRAMLLCVGGFRLLVGRDIREVVAIRQVLRRASFYGITLTLVSVGCCALYTVLTRRLLLDDSSSHAVVADPVRPNSARTAGL